MSKNYGKIILAGLILAISILLEVKQKSAFGWGFDFALVAILILPLFLDFAEFLFFGALAFFLFRPIYPWSTLESALLALLPILAFIFQKIFPWQSWLEPFFLVFLGIAAFYGIANPSLFFESFNFPALDISVSMVFGWAVYSLMSAFAGRRS